MNVFLTQEQFRNAIQKGLGRAILHLKHNPSTPYLEEVIYACTHYTGWDQQCEDARDKYLRWAIALTGSHPSIREAILEALSTSTEPSTTYQLFALACGYAAKGDQHARRWVYEKFDRNDAEAEFVGADAIIELDGIEGLLHVARRIGQDVLHGISNGAVYLSATVGEGEAEEKARRALSDAASSDSAIRAYVEAMAADEAAMQARRDARNREACSFEQLRAQVEASEDGVPKTSLYAWARSATPDDLLNAARAIEQEDRPDRLRQYLRIFVMGGSKKRPYPLAPDRLIALVSSDDLLLARYALTVLGRMKHPAIRQLFFDLVSSRRQLESAFELLGSNFVLGDERFISDWLTESQAGGTTPLTTEELHGVSHDLMQLFEAVEAVEAKVPLLWAYENTPCSTCRSSALGLLIKRGAASEDLLKESRYDCHSWTREQAGKALQESRRKPPLPGT